MLSGWTKFINISLYNNITTLTGYQVKFVINRSTGNNDGDNIYVGTSCREDYGDLRFTDTSDNLLPYWIEPGYTSSSAIVWVKCTLTGTAYTNIVLQYGKSDATTVSNGSDTFPFFDDFSGGSVDSSKWTITGSPVITDGILRCTSGQDILGKTSFSTGYILNARAALFDPVGSSVSDFACIRFNQNPGYVDIRSTGNFTGIQQISSNNGSTSGTPTISTSALSHTYRIVRISESSCKYYRDTTLLRTVTSYLNTGSGAIQFNSVDSGYVDVDYVFVTIYASIEPTKYYPHDLSEWRYRKSHVITHPSGGLTDYQVKITVYRDTESISDGSSVHLPAAHVLSSFGDIRFTNADGDELDFWIESTNGTQSAVFWVEIDSIGTSTTIYLYYGHEECVTTSNGNTTFPLFDDFTTDLSKWTNHGGTTLSGGIATISATLSQVFGITSLQTFGTGYAIVSRIRYAHYNSSSYDEAFIASYIDEYNYIAAYPCHRFGPSYCPKYNNSNQSGGDPNSIDISGLSAGTYVNQECKKLASSAVWSVNDGSIVTNSDQYITGSGAIRFRAYNNGASLSIDWVYVRKCDTTEPIHSSWGAEQDLEVTFLTVHIIPSTGTDPLTVGYGISLPDDVELTDFVLNYGDGTTYTSESQSTGSTFHTYNEPGIYTVWAEGYTEDDAFVHYEIPYGITVNAEAVVASFTYDQNYNTITFTDLSTGNVNEWYWDFGDGNYSYEQNPTHTYYNPATYTVTLYVSNQYQYDTFATTVTITQVLTPPEVYFTPNNLNVISPTLPYSVTFTNLSTPAFGCTYNWLIDDTSYTTTDATHSFATYGMYDVGLTVTNALGSATKTYNNAIRITRKSKTFYEVINYADTPATFHVEVFNEVATSADTIIQAHIFDESINFVQDEIPDEPGLDEWGMRHFYSSINEWGHRIISAVTDWGNRILYNGSTLDNSPVTLFKAQEFREDVVFIDEWQFGTT